MSAKEKEFRPQSVINQEYTDTALQYGDLLIKVELNRHKVVDLKQKLFDLCKEVSKEKHAESPAQVAEAPVAVEEAAKEAP